MFISWVFGLIFIISIYALLRSVRIINQYEKGIILRLGKYHMTVSSGLTILMPFVDSLLRVDMREQVINVEPQQVITKDNVLVTVDAVIYYKVVDPVKAEFEIEDFDRAATTLAQTNLRNLIGDKMLDETLTARDHINSNLRTVLDEATNSWGVKVMKVELQKIDPPQEIVDAMSKQMIAERVKRAQILSAQGSREANILEAQGKAQATLLKADADAKAIEMVAKAAEKNFTTRAQDLRRLEVTEKVLGDGATKYVIPTSSEVVNVLNLDGSGVVPVRKK